MRRMIAENAEISEGIEKLDRLYPAVTIEQAFDKGLESLKFALNKFHELGLGIHMQTINEDNINIQSELNLIKSRLTVAERYFEAISKYNKLNPNLKVDGIVKNLSIHCGTIDNYVKLCNDTIYLLIKENKWIDNEALQYKALYTKLIAAVIKFYWIIPIQVENGESYIRKTKNIQGKLLFDKATMPSATDLSPNDWLNDHQWLLAMKPSELKRKDLP